MNTKIIPTADSPVTIATATSSLTLYIQKQEIEGKLKALGVELIEIARGKTMSINIPGQGNVVVTKPSDPTPVPGESTYTFNQEAFLNLTPAMRRNLQNAGVVIVAPKVKGGSSASVRHTPNK
jgi:hypothetical protein